MTIPLDEPALEAIEHALDGCLTYTADDGTELVEPRRVGADYGLHQLLDFWAGIDPDEEGVMTGYAGNIPIYEMPGVYLSERDLIRALIGALREARTP